MSNTFDIEDVASIGAIRDVPSYMLPPEAWNLALNMRAIDNGLEALSGWEQVFGTPGVAPHFAMPVVTAAQTFWLYSSLTKIYVYDGTTHTDITRTVGGNYAANDTPDWNGTLLGGVPIMNNGTDVPQFWSPTNLATKMVNLTNWPATLKAKIIRAFGPYLLAFNLTDAGNPFPHAVQWSHPADPGSIPSSWDITDPTKDAGRKDFPDVNAGLLMDALPLGTLMYVYKESSTWKMRAVGGRFIFDFGESAWLTTVGLLAPRCVCVTSDGQRHVIASQDDILWHDGNTVNSILNKKQRRRLFNEIDTANFAQSFIFDNPIFKEIWFCYPSTGQVYPDKALVMNYADPKNWVITEADGITFRNAVSGRIEQAGSELWDDGTDDWDVDTGPWSELLRRRVILSSPANTKFFNLDKGMTRDGTTFSTTLQRLGLSVLGGKDKDNPVVDFQTMKMFHRVWPKIVGGPVSVRLGSQDYPNGPVTWGQSVVFDPTLHAGHGVPGPATGRAVAIEYSTMNSTSWRLDGYKAEVEPLGDF